MKKPVDKNIVDSNVENTIEALKELNIMGNTYWHYKEVLTILKSKL